jgi:Fe-S oxidoreductase
MIVLLSCLAWLAYRCNLCRRCAQACPMGADNGLVAHELRKLFSQEMGIAPKELHAAGSPGKSSRSPGWRLRALGGHGGRCAVGQGVDGAGPIRFNPAKGSRW